MRFSHTIILLILFSLLGTYVVFFETGLKKEPNPAEEPHKILNFDFDEVEEIKLKTKHGDIFFAKKDQQWKILSPIQAAAISGSVNSLLSVYDFPIIKSTIPNPLVFSDYGLSDPEIEFGLRVKGEKEFKTLFIGNNTPSGLDCYAKLESNPEVFIVGLIFKTMLARELKSFTVQ